MNLKHETNQVRGVTATCRNFARDNFATCWDKRKMWKCWGGKNTVAKSACFCLLNETLRESNLQLKDTMFSCFIKSTKFLSLNKTYLLRLIVNTQQYSRRVQLAFSFTLGFSGPPDSVLWKTYTIHRSSSLCKIHFLPLRVHRNLLKDSFHKIKRGN